MPSQDIAVGATLLQVKVVGQLRQLGLTVEVGTATDIGTLKAVINGDVPITLGTSGWITFDVI